MDNFNLKCTADNMYVWPISG